MVTAAHKDIRLAHDEYVAASRRSKLTDAMLLGNLLHSAVLEPRDFSWRYISLPPGFTKARKADKLRFEKMTKDLQPGQQIVKHRLMEPVQAMARSCLNLKFPGTDLYLEDVVNSSDSIRTEVSGVWEDDSTGLTCKARLDFYGFGASIDLKTTHDFLGFENELFNRGYHRQAPHYQALLEAMGESEVPWYWLVVSSEAPYSARWVEASTELLDLGRSERERSMGKILDAYNSNSWVEPSVYDPTLATVPDWYLNKRSVA